MKKNPKVVILARVSTKAQETDRQVAELQEVADKASWDVVEVIAEVVSGAAGKPKGWEITVEREALVRVLWMAEKGKIDKVLVHEVSRIARRNSDSHRFLERLTDAGVSLYWHTQNIETLLPSGKTNPAASIMFALLSELARSERETLRERIKSGLKEAKRKGVDLGRPVGSQEAREVFLEKHPDVIKHLSEGVSMRRIRDITGKSLGTIQKVRNRLA
jgi:DNA invertase Pin-like site-specific DNA recombinase